MKGNIKYIVIIFILVAIIFFSIGYYHKEIKNIVMPSVKPNEEILIKIDSNERVRYKEMHDISVVLYDSIYNVIDRPIGDSERTKLAERIYADIIRLNNKIRAFEDSAQTNSNKP